MNFLVVSIPFEMKLITVKSKRMKSTYLLISFLTVAFLVSCKNQIKRENNQLVIGRGQVPSIARDSKNNLYIVYGTGDSIMYSFSNNNGKEFSPPSLVAVLPKLAASHMRGPQIAATTDGITIIASNKPGDIFSYIKDDSGKWLQTGKVNDVADVAKEGFMSLSAEGKNTFAVWLDLRDKHNKIFGARSADGGKTWSANKLIYASPDTTVCECCKPSVAIRGNKVFVMFRNWLHGNRDLHLIQSVDGGNTFGEAKKLGNDSWALNGCPMDGGGLSINKNGDPETVWRRKKTIYACVPGQPETAIGEGRSCTIASVNGKNVYAWTENEEVVILKPMGIKKVLGKGSLPVLTAINNQHILCVWENDNQIQAAIIEL